MQTNTTRDFRPSWWNEANMTAWDRVKEAVRRDWQQTKHDLGVGGHELNQGIGDTVEQAAGKQPIPPPTSANPPKVIGDWDEVEAAIRYGHAAHGHFVREFPAWNAQLEGKLRVEWEASDGDGASSWKEVREHVRRGYEFRH
ncbi:MAG: hypothetical protein JNL79_21440 [Myxococcales bacterium]|nr:hypothetical protein [Myxococcales bacterium]